MTQSSMSPDGHDDLIIPEQPGAPFRAEARRVAAGRGARWLAEGWQLFRHTPWRWMLLLLISSTLYLLSSVTQPLGTLLSMLLGPLLTAGLMSFAHQADCQDDARIGRLFDGFRQHAGRLLTLGLLYMLLVLAALLVTLVVAGLLVGAGLLPEAGSVQELTEGQFAIATGLLLLFLALFLPVGMAYWFAPMLVFFSGLKPTQALKASLMASLRNWRPLLVYSLVLAAVGLLVLLALSALAALWKATGASLALLALIVPLMMVGGLALYALLTATFYQSFKDFFGPSDS